MLLFGSGRNLSPKPHRHLALAWALLVLAVHAVVAWRWQPWQPALPAIPPRLQIAMSQPLHAKAAPAPAAKAKAARRLGPALPALPQSVAALVPNAPASAAAVLAQVQTLPQAAQLVIPEAPPGDEVGPEWPLSTRLRFALTGNYNGPVHGDAEVEWLRQGANYQMRLRVAVGPRLAPFLQRDLISSGRVGPGGIEPRRYDEQTRILFGSPRQLMVLLDERWVQLADGRQVPAPAGVQDSASQFVQLSWLLLTGRETARPGHRIELPLALPRALRPWRYEVVEQLEIDTPLGLQTVWHLKPQGVDARGALLAELWLAPALQWLPVRIRILQEPHWVELNLAEVPLQEAPARDNAASQPQALSP